MKSGWLQTSMFANRKFQAIFPIVCLATTMMICLWAIDVSISAINANKCFEEYAEMHGNQLDEPVFTLTNGFYYADPAKVYHIALFGMIFLIVFLATMAAFYSIKDL